MHVLSLHFHFQLKCLFEMPPRSFKHIPLVSKSAGLSVEQRRALLGLNLPATTPSSSSFAVSGATSSVAASVDVVTAAARPVSSVAAAVD